MPSFLDLLEQIRTQASPEELGPGAPEAEIRAAEQALGVSFPTGYREFLRVLGYSFWPVQIYGIASPELAYMHVVKATQDARLLLRPNLPLSLVPVSPDGRGGEYCLDTAAAHDGECPIVCWDRERGPDQLPRNVAPSFLAWLEATIRDRIREDSVYGPVEAIAPPPAAAP